MVWSYLSVQLESSSDFCEVFFLTSLQFELFKLSTWTLMGVERVTISYVTCQNQKTLHSKV